MYSITIAITIAITITIAIHNTKQSELFSIKSYFLFYAHILRVASQEVVQRASPDADIPIQETRFS